MRDDALSAQPDASAELIVLNPPFHIGSSVHAGIALKLFEDAARVLRPGGELWTVWNTHLGYRPALNRIVGQTHQVGRNNKFTVTVSHPPLTEGHRAVLVRRRCVGGARRSCARVFGAPVVVGPVLLGFARCRSGRSRLAP